MSAIISTSIFKNIILQTCKMDICLVLYELAPKIIIEQVLYKWRWQLQCPDFVREVPLYDVGEHGALWARTRVEIMHGHELHIQTVDHLTHTKLVDLIEEELTQLTVVRALGDILEIEGPKL